MNDPRKNIEPGRSKKRAALSARKVPRKFGSIVLPGLFDIAYPHRDTILFLIAIFLECYGLHNLRLVGDIQLMAAGGLFALDLVAALMWHCGQARRAELANRLAVTSDPAERAALKVRYPLTFTVVRILGAIAIVGLAVFKTLTFMSFTGGETPLGTILLIAVTYGVVGLIHLLVTGFFLANLSFQIGMLIERRKTLRHEPLSEAPNYVKGHRRHLFETVVKLEPTTLGKHELVFLGDHSGIFAFDLRSWGLLLDAELSEMILNQHTLEQKAILAEEGLRAQLEILESDPVAQSSGAAGAATPPATPATAKSAALLLLCGGLLGASCAERRPAHDTLEVLPLAVLAQNEEPDRLRKALMEMVPDEPIATEEGSFLIPTLTLFNPGSPEVSVTIEGAPETNLLDRIWGRKPSPSDHLADLREKLIQVDLQPLLATPTPSGSQNGAQPLGFDALLVAQIERLTPDANAPTKPLVVSWMTATDPEAQGVDSPENVIVRDRREWLDLLGKTLKSGPVPIIVVAYGSVPEASGSATLQPEELSAPPLESPKPQPVKMPEPAQAVGRLFTIRGSAVTKEAVMKTAEAWLRNEGFTSIGSFRDDVGGGVTVRGLSQSATVSEIRIEPTESTSGENLQTHDTCEIAMAPAGAAIEPAHTTEHVLGIVPIAVGVHPSNPIREISLKQISAILNGTIDDWRELGVGGGRITAIVPDGAESDALMARRLPGLRGMKARRLAEVQIARAVNEDPLAIGFLPLHLAGSSLQVLGVSADGQGLSISPEASTVARDDYPLCVVYSLYTTRANEGDEEATERCRDAGRFVRFATLDPEGQALVAQAGLFGQQLRFQSWDERRLVMRPTEQVQSETESEPERRFRALVGEGSEQASIVFRFSFNDSTLDARSQDNLARLADLLKTPAMAGSRLILIGFADSVGTDAACDLISKTRAEMVQTALAQYGVLAEVAAGFGKLLPVDTNSTEEGRARNRRVEVWLKRGENVATRGDDRRLPGG
jgi:phosphate transport system substrate-binding protein